MGSGPHEHLPVLQRPFDSCTDSTIPIRRRAAPVHAIIRRGGAGAYPHLPLLILYRARRLPSEYPHDCREVRHLSYLPLCHALHSLHRFTSHQSASPISHLILWPCLVSCPEVAQTLVQGPFWPIREAFEFEYCRGPDSVSDGKERCSQGS